MSKSAREITDYMPGNSPHPVLITSDSLTGIYLFLTDTGSVTVDESVLPNMFRCVGESLQNFFDGECMRRSLWFKSQRSHTFTALSAQDSKTGKAFSSLRLAVTRTETGYLIQTPEEARITGEYYDARVMEEARIFYDRLIHA